MENKYKGKPIFVNSDDDFLTRGGEQAKKLWLDAGGSKSDLENYASQVNLSKEEMLKASEIPKDMQGYKEVEGSLKVNGVKI